MEIDELPIGERLDALLRQFEDDSRDAEGDFDYAQFVERRVHEHGPVHGNDADADPTASNGRDTAFDSDAENQWFNDIESEGDDALVSPLSSPGRPQSLAKQAPPPKKPKLKTGKKTPRRHNEAANASMNNEKHNELASNDINEHVAVAYSEAGLDMANLRSSAKEPAKRRTANQAQRQLEEAARQDQRLERMLVDDIGSHTVKTVTVDDFLADFEGTTLSPPASSPVQPRQADKRFSELVSSPPRMQGLRSFMSHGDSHRHPAGPLSPAASTGDGADNSDSDLEIIPDTRAARMPQPIRELLRLGGGTAASRQLAATRAKLQRMERDQILNRSRSRAEKLKAQGFDVEDLTNALHEQHQANGQGASAWLARERAENEALVALERSDEGEPASASESEAFSSDLEIEGDVEDANDDEAGRASRHGRMVMLSDSEDEQDLETKPAAGMPVSQQTSIPGHKATGRITQSGAEPETETDEDENGSFTGGTQYVAPLSPQAHAALFGSRAGTLDPNADAAASISETLPDTLPDILPDTLLSRGLDEGGSSDLEIEIGRDAEEEKRMEPDLADLRDSDLSLSQRMAEVRQRYLRAEHEQRRQLIQQKQSTRKVLKSAFVEDQAEESEDEEGAGGIRRINDTGNNDEDDNDDDEDAGDADLEGLVDHAAVNVREAKLKQKFIEEERKRDEKMLNHFVEGVNGGFRRRQARDANGVFLSDDDMEFDNNEGLRAYRQMLEQKRQAKLLGSDSRVARLAASERSKAFFQSITTELIARPPGAERSTPVQDGLEFLRSVADSSHRQPSASMLRIGSEAAATADHSSADTPTTGLSTALKLASVRNPKQTRRPSRQPTIQDPFSTLGARRSTYASRVSASEAPLGKTVEIMKSLGPAQPSRPKKKFAAVPTGPGPKRRQMMSTTAHKSDSALFHRNWN